MELYNGRPEDTSGRKEKEIKVYDILDSLHIPYIRADHEAVMTMEACEEIDKALGMEICKNLFLCNRKKTSYYLLLMPGNMAVYLLSHDFPATYSPVPALTALFQTVRQMNLCVHIFLK